MSEDVWMFLILGFCIGILVGMFVGHWLGVQETLAKGDEHE